MDNDFMGPNAMAAVELHEVFANLVAAGFNEDQAMQLLIAFINAQTD